MTEQHVPGPGTDLAYDLAHEAHGAHGAHEAHEAHGPAPSGEGDHADDRAAENVCTATPDYDGGDYSYDLAHDVPRTDT